MTAIHYNVAPRYTAGSPAQVPKEVAERVCSQEREHHAIALTGAYGERMEWQARTLGLRSIVECRLERPQGWLVLDMLTEERFFRFSSYGLPAPSGYDLRMRSKGNPVCDYIGCGVMPRGGDYTQQGTVLEIIATVADDNRWLQTFIVVEWSDGTRARLNPNDLMVIRTRP